MLATMPRPKPPRVHRGPMPFTARLVCPEEHGKRRRSQPFGYRSQHVAESRMYALLRRDGMSPGSYVVIARVHHETTRGSQGEPRHRVTKREKVLVLKRVGHGRTARIERIVPSLHFAHQQEIESPYAD